MFEVTDVVVSVVIYTAVSFFVYLYSKKSAEKARNGTTTGLTDKQRRKKEGFAQKELWEHKAHAITLGVALFIMSFFNIAMGKLDFSFWPRLVCTVVAIVAIVFIVKLTTYALFRYFRNRSSQNT